MARIAGVDLPRDKKVEIGLTYIYGIGRELARRIVESAGVDADLRIRDLNDADVNKIRQRDRAGLSSVEGALRTEVAMNIKRLMDIGSYRGIRHRRGLPVRGQRTHTNARTKKGPRRAIAGKKKSHEVIAFGCGARLALRGLHSRALHSAHGNSENRLGQEVKARRGRRRGRAHQRDVQQHDDHHHRHAR